MRMKRALRCFGGAVVVLVLALLALQRNSKIQTDVSIARPPADVGQILTATDAYPGWNSFIHRLSGDLRPGNRIEVEITPPNSSPMTFRPVRRTKSRDPLAWFAGLIALALIVYVGLHWKKFD